MARHAKAVDRRVRAIRVSTVTTVWLAGLGAGFFGILGATARFGCASGDTGLACGTSGSVLGIVLVLIVVAVVTTVTVVTQDRPARQVLITGGVAVAALAACFACAEGLLATA